MSSNAPEFPFQFLPLLARENVVKVMEGQDRLSFSVISSNTNKLSKPLKQQSKMVKINFDGDIIKIKSNIEQFPTLTIKLEGNDDFTPRQVYSERQYVDGGNRRDRRQRYLARQNEKSRKDLNRPSYSARDWIDHFMVLLKCQAVELRLQGKGVNRWDAPALLELIQGLNVEQIELVGEVGEIGVRVVEHCPTVKRAHFGLYFPTGDERMALMSREFDAFSTRASRHLKLSLQEVLLLRSKVMSMMNTNLSTFSWNVLLKEWVNGWNPNFEALFFRCRGRIGHVTDILEGIDYELVDDDTDVSRFCCGTYFWELGEWNQKAYQIRRTGVKANLNFAPHENNRLMAKLIIVH